MRTNRQRTNLVTPIEAIRYPDPITSVYANRFLHNRSYHPPQTNKSVYTPPPLPYSHAFARPSDESLAEETARHISMITDHMNRLYRIADTLTISSPFSVFSERTIETNHDSVISRKICRGAAQQAYVLELLTLASPQLNQGRELPISDKGAFAAGWNSFAVSYRGQAYTFSIYIFPEEESRIVLSKLRETINRARIGLYANLHEDADHRTTRLTITGMETGSAEAYTFQDITGNVVSVSGVNHAVQPATNTEYRINGGLIEASASRRIELEPGKVEIEIGARPQDLVDLRVDMRVVLDSLKVVEALRQTVGCYNEWMQAAAAAGNAVHARAMQPLLYSAHSPAAERCGIYRTGNGRLILEEKFVLEGLTGGMDSLLHEEIVQSVNAWASGLCEAMEWIRSLPAEALLNGFGTHLQRYIGYSPDMDYRWLMPLHGLYFNHKF
ncbi:hypothetical protein [Paenibacillus turpanensis]|uniref:hypothetical protein n=1 Tax=Paenibacillus turpanensis TaxID=2689078 RepID=UPI00140CFB09|nr:hypothetical protein [Paenibacillus turpanensis]